MKSTMRILAAAVLAAFAASAAAQTDPFAGPVTTLDKTGANRGQALVASKIASNFERFAGSPENALALTNALRNGQTVQLTYAATGTGTTPTTVTYDPPTGQMGWGNVKISLALAADQLARLGITNPTAEQLQAALNGGSVTVTNANGTTTTTQLRGVLQMRADGMGWGEIAKVGGTKVGPVVSQLKMANTKVAAIPPSSGGTTSAAGNTAVTKATGSGKGVTTGAGSAATTGAGGSGKGLTTAGGAANSHSARGITTATGATGGGQGQGNAYGRGITTGAGGSAAQVQHGKPAHAGGGQGIVSATGGSASAGVTNAGGNSGGQGKGQGGGHGKGKGG